MDKAAIAQASRRLAIAQKAHALLASASNHDEFSDSWYTLIVAAKSVWTLLEQGSKSSPQSRQWFGGKKRERRDDELLQYMFEARNAAEHGLEDVVRHQPPYNRLEGRFAVGETPGLKSGTQITGMQLNFSRGLSIVGVDPEGNDISLPIESRIVDYPETSRLASITTRGSVVLKPPQKHLGKHLIDDHPASVAKANLDYLAAMIAEAEAL
ncbi:hypothetical protein [Sphingomonas sp.]|uniref:hypothetical protein n=1 Tax=Sphingomonas sp. TaxID=28214 RepID=UPI002ED7E6B1